MHFFTQPLTGEIKCLRLYLCLAHSIPSPSMLMQHMHQPITKWYDPLHIITWPYWFIDLDLTCSSPLRLSIGAKSFSSFTVTRGPSLQSLRLALHTCNRSIEQASSWSSPPWSHNSMSCLICNELLHDTITYGLIPCVSHINTVSPPKVVTQLLKPNKDLSVL
jgi:hypothetical protein